MLSCVLYCHFDLDWNGLGVLALSAFVWLVAIDLGPELPSHPFAGVNPKPVALHCDVVKDYLCVAFAIIIPAAMLLGPNHRAILISDVEDLIE